MIRTLLLAATLLATTAPMAHAAPSHDPRLATRLYRADEVVRVDGRMGVQASIVFADDEHIENVAVGDSESWQITPNKRANLLFVKPLAANARTNMTVVTDQHTYFFDLIAAPSATPVYALRFTYPETAKPAAGPQQAAGVALTEAERGALDGQRPVDPASLNFAWRRTGSDKLLPARIYDDGQATYVIWAAGAPIPAILVRNEKGDEGPVNFAVRGDTIVIDGVPALIVLRSGKASATLVNQRPVSARAPVVPASVAPSSAAPSIATVAAAAPQPSVPSNSQGQ